MSLDTLGPPSPWISTASLAARPAVRKAIAKAQASATRASDPQPIDNAYIDETIASVTAQVTEILYRMSGSFFRGEAGPITIRPLSRPVDADTLGLIYRGYGPNGYGITGPGATSAPPAIANYGVTYAPVIEFYGYYPVRRIISVYIDGVLIPPEQYELRDRRSLVRVLPLQTSTPTERYGWPTSQQQSLADTQNGTFSITFTYGADPGESGRRAALALGEVLVRAALGDTSALPERTTSVVRQGLSVQSVSALDVLKMGGTGIFEVDLWLKTVNPSGATAPSIVLTPDRPLPQRQGRRYH